MADKTGFSPAQLALGWLLSQDGVGSAIIGPETLAELEDNVPIADLELPAEVIAQIDAIGRLPFSVMAI